MTYRHYARFTDDELTLFLEQWDKRKNAPDVPDIQRQIAVNRIAEIEKEQKHRLSEPNV